MPFEEGCNEGFVEAVISRDDLYEREASTSKGVLCRSPNAEPSNTERSNLSAQSYYDQIIH